MRILVAGATGYVGSRLVPTLLADGHDVVAAASSQPRPDRFSWGGDVESVRMDATDLGQVRAATRGVDAVCFLVHSLDVREFRARDRAAASAVRAAVDENGVRRLIYLSGLVPSVPEGRLSQHIASRLEVERLLMDSAAATLSLRAGIVIGAGSTSFEIVRQLASLLLVQPVPAWLRSRVQPIAVADVVRTLADAVASDVEGAVDVGGPDVLSYAELLHAYGEVAGLRRLQVPSLGPPVSVAALTAGLATAAPFWTVAALVHSLRHDMVCRPGQPDPRVLDVASAVPVRQAITDALLDAGPAGSRTSDPDWVRLSALERAVARLPIPGTTVLSSAMHVADSRVRGVLGMRG